MTNYLHSLIADMQGLCKVIGRRVQIMEVCGTHTVSFFRSGIRSLLPGTLRLVSGPGCPVCVTAQRHIDAAIELATMDGVILATYGDMLRVPGRLGSLEGIRSEGACVRVINSARAALDLARAHPDRPVIFLGVGFETTAPASAAVVLEAERDGIENFGVLSCHKRVVPAMAALLQSEGVPLDGFLCPGHVSVIIGSDAYRPIVELYGKPCVVAGFEPKQLLTGLVHLLRQVVSGQSKLENVYPAVVHRHGNRVALALLDQVFEHSDAPWRALGVIPQSGLDFRPAYQRFDALRRLDVTVGADLDNPACRCGEVIQGKIDPVDCPLFDRGCTPLMPIGPCMVSSEGTCSAWHKYNRMASRSSTLAMKARVCT
ncbi:MAG: hydrogenase formation protein HypD [Planctomycetota bacterium]